MICIAWCAVGDKEGCFDHIPPSFAEVKIAWMLTSTPGMSSLCGQGLLYLHAFSIEMWFLASSSIKVTAQVYKLFKRTRNCTWNCECNYYDIVIAGMSRQLMWPSSG
jgi:hypothetical protein